MPDNISSQSTLHFLKNIIAFMANRNDVWVLANHKNVLSVSQKAEKILGIYKGMRIAENSLLKKVFDTKVRQIWQLNDENNKDLSIMGIPLINESKVCIGVFLYTKINKGNIQQQDILELLHDMNQEKDMEHALRILTNRSLKMFDSSMAGIWLLKEEGFQLLALSTDTQDQEKFLTKIQFPGNFREFIKYNSKENQAPKMFVLELDKNNEGPFSFWVDGLKEFEIKCVLGIPLFHFSQLLGGFFLFSPNSNFLNKNSLNWLNPFVPLISSFVYEHQLLTAAWEKEQALTLLLRGTEILVQAYSEEQLLTEAGEMAMEILYLEAGFFLMQEGDSWQIRAPFGRLKQHESGWEEQVLRKFANNRYIPHEKTTLKTIELDNEVIEIPFKWSKILIQPLQTHSGVVGELWLMDSREKALEQRQEILTAFVRGVGVALETIRQRSELERIATTDPLTGILNRQGFEQRLREEMAGTSRRKSSFLILILDLDGFKKLNDTQGHPTGDFALRKMAQNIRISVREQDIVARTGGDEFTVILTDLKKGKEALEIIKRLKEKMGLEEFGLGVSIGGAEYPTEARNYEGLYRMADQRLYIGKYSGKGKIVLGEDISD